MRSLDVPRALAVAPALALVAGLAAPAPAVAQPVAIDPPASTPPPAPTPAEPLPVAPAVGSQPAGRPPPDAAWGHPHAGIGGGLTFGLVHARGLDDGWFGRLELEALPVLGRRGHVGGLFGFLTGLETWRSGSGWGLSLPLALAIGVRAPGVRAGLLMGFEAFFVDRVASDTGVGFYAPMGGARVSVDVGGWTAGVDARVVRRWQLGADDHTQWQLGLAITHDWESDPREPYR